MGFLRVAISGLVAGLMFVQGLVCAVAALIAQGGRVRPSLDILTHFAPFWLASAVVVVGYALLLAPRQLRMTFLTLGGVGVIASSALILPEFTRPMSPRAPAGAANQIKVIQFNVWGRNADLGETAQWIVDQNPDIVVVEEASVAIREALVARRAYHVVCGDCQVMIFSKLRPVDSGAPASPAGQPRPPIARGTYRNAGGEFVVLGVHYTWPTQGSLQQQQGRRLAWVLDHYPKEAMILTGDFNSTPWSFSRRREDRLFGLERRTRALFSWPAGEFSGRRIKMPFPFLPIDHVYAGKTWKTVSVKRGPRLGSDHYPVIVTLARAAP
ncbi:MAG: endonuclease/exonuclease/phosphatase family protein [Phenylobacterium sp.]|jgi:endonuclease/exonuclease/phosphatase (EEP) superfamily protein YafD|uniref:endonuclease/exonuclease/phosphatase family protein n=1 Tax=Phenylobacterium sp. TaxID=1871053 RepID=UPI001B791399|nr:endonuclease/exonuclease/phosphatase family protein [Phenylobacterium sp.]MBP7649941.1 endonuclease/exonuclease/phosphatase family protein [Phenylobacterium sp.]MBP7814921.1 endonuclease/exonuclease/phosphatase family protein [Phenylobacterium sp.]MBP9231133.1 endonuclease/exonuclease/phosphatase family protein [Phenylobacterium sp.]MBP9753740.1 endonuclease/exonuclease/phosphatase family protein [Phenylobacterium sp.]